MENGMQFETKDEELTVREFYEHYRDSLPQLAVVIQGYHGEIGIETFGLGQVLRIFACYTQKRVMASVYHEIGRTKLDDKLLSMPLDGDTKFHVRDPGIEDNREWTLSELLKHEDDTEGAPHSLPIDLQFADETQAKSVGLAFRKIDQTLHLRLFERFDEDFLLGNPIIEGCVHAKVVEIPTYLPTMKMALVTGIKGHDLDTWRRYKREMRDSIERNTRGNIRYGCQEIAVYSAKVLHTYKNYALLPPMSYIKSGPDDSTLRMSLIMEFIYEPTMFGNVKKRLSNLRDSDTLSSAISEQAQQSEKGQGQSNNGSGDVTSQTHNNGHVSTCNEEKHSGMNKNQEHTEANESGKEIERNVKRENTEMTEDEVHLRHHGTQSGEEEGKIDGDVEDHDEKYASSVLHQETEGDGKEGIHESEGGYEIHFDFSKEEYTVKEFYERFKYDLPKVVMVTQGYHGEIGIESFSRGQVIRLHKCAAQKRVKAEPVQGHCQGLEGCQISIPLNYKSKFYEIKPGHLHLSTKRKEHTLEEILGKHKGKHHPEVKFSKLEESYVLHLDSKLRKTSQNIHLKLMETYQDVYILGNPISEGCLYARVMALPVYLPDLKLSVVTGITGCSQGSWERYQKEMSETVKSHVDFDSDYANQNIAVYSKETKEKAQDFTFASPEVICKQEVGDKNNMSAFERSRANSSAVCLYKPLALLDIKAVDTKLSENDSSAKTDNSDSACFKNGIHSNEKQQSSSMGDKDKNSQSADKTSTQNKGESERNERYGIQFLNEENRYIVQQFYDTFTTSLPKLVKVVQGHYGDLGTDTFDKDQVIRVHTQYTQRRVVAEVRQGHTTLSGKRLTIPVEYPLEFRTVEQHNAQSSHSFSLQTILDYNQLPVDIKFDRSCEQKTCLIGQRKYDISLIPTMTVTEKLEESYLIGSPVSDGCLYSRIVEIPVHLPDLELSVITGAENSSKDAWESYMKGMSEIVHAKIDFDQDFGNKEITFYAPETYSSNVHSLESTVHEIQNSPDETKTPNENNTQTSQTEGASVDNTQTSQTEGASNETNVSSPNEGVKIGLLEEVLAAAYGRRPESVCLYEPHALTVDMNVRQSKVKDTVT